MGEENKLQEIINYYYTINSKKKNTLSLKSKTNIVGLVSNSLKFTNKKKNTKIERILGCKISDFKSYIEGKFENWMTWDNKGLYNGKLNYGWDLDHIIPISSARNEEDILKLNHYTNLQPMCSKTNRYIKKDNINIFSILDNKLIEEVPLVYTTILNIIDTIYV